MTTPKLDQRKNVLTDDDFVKIGDAFDERMSTLFETIGYDVGSPQERANIREDHVWIRSIRVGTEKLKTGAVLSLVGSAAVALLYALWVGVKASIMAVK